MFRASVLACLALAAGAVPQSTEESQAPPLYSCQGGSCVISARGLPLAECQQVCLSANYSCVNSQCVVASRGLPKAECTQVCGGPGPPPPAPGGQTIVDLALATPELSTLVTALKAGGLVGTLSGKGPFTVFAPTNKAFAALKSGALDNLLAPENKNLLVELLGYHVIPQNCSYPVGGDPKIPPGCGGSLRTVEGQNITVKVISHPCGRQGRNKCYLVSLETDGRTGANGRVQKPVPITVRAVQASNGVVHIIETVLEKPEYATIAGLAVATPKLSTLVTALKAGGLVDALSFSAGHKFTVFAPSDEAFAALPAGFVENLLKPANRVALVELLTYHLVLGDVQAEDINDGESIKTVRGADVKARISGGGNISINGAKVTTANLNVRNGVVHIIDAVLSPPSGPVPPPPGGNHLYFRGFSGSFLSGNKKVNCGDVDAAPRMPAAIFEPSNFAALEAYIDITIKLFSVQFDQVRSPTLQVGRCVDSFLPNGE